MPKRPVPASKITAETRVIDDCSIKIEIATSIGVMIGCDIKTRPDLFIFINAVTSSIHILKGSMPLARKIVRLSPTGTLLLITEKRMDSIKTRPKDLSIAEIYPIFVVPCSESRLLLTNAEITLDLTLSAFNRELTVGW